MKYLVRLILVLALIASNVVADDTISSGLTLVVPSIGSRNWGTTFKNSFATPISSHDHTGGGKGLQISTNALATNAVTGAKIRLANDEYLKARNAANSADLNLLKLSNLNKLVFDSTNVDNTTRASLALGTGDSPTFTNATLTGVLNTPAVTNAGTLSLRATGANVILTQTNGVNRWSVDSDGRYNPQADDTYEIGSAANTVKNIWVKPRTWTPTVTYTGATTANSVTFARYTRVGKLVFFNFAISFTTVVGVSKVEVSMPSTGASLGNPQGGSCFYTTTTGPAYEPTAWFLDTAGDSTIEFHRISGNFGGAGGISCTGYYEEA